MGRRTGCDTHGAERLQADAGLLTEVLLHGETGTTLLIAAEAYSREEWPLHDESVVALPSPAAADPLALERGRGSRGNHRRARTRGTPAGLTAPEQQAARHPQQAGTATF